MSLSALSDELAQVRTKKKEEIPHECASEKEQN